MWKIYLNYGSTARFGGEPLHLVMHLGTEETKMLTESELEVFMKTHNCREARRG